MWLENSSIDVTLFFWCSTGQNLDHVKLYHFVLYYNIFHLNILLYSLICSIIIIVELIKVFELQ